MQSITVIFDIDGVIVDSEQLHFDVLCHLAPEYAGRYQPQQLIGLSLEETLEHIKVPRSLQSDITSKIIGTYREKLNITYLRPGVAALAADLERCGVKFGFVSTAPRDICLANIGLLGLKNIPILISGDDVALTKPHPDPYLAMLTLLNTAAEDVLVIEDTDLGVLAAIRAGIEHVYAWPHALSAQQHYKHATRIIERLSDIDAFKSFYPAV
ncbi:HAD family hydrolase [Aeromonas jandaei]